MPKDTGARQAQPQGRRVCRCCGHTKPFELFKSVGRGLRGHVCKLCDAKRASARWHADVEASRAKRSARRRRNLEKERAQQRARYWRNVDAIRAQGRAHARTERARANNRRAVAKYQKTHPEVIAAQHAAQRAVRRGELKVALVCEVKGCRETKHLHLHHNSSYDKPHDVIRTCRLHHEAIHHSGRALELKPGAGRKWARAPKAMERRHA